MADGYHIYLHLDEFNKRSAVAGGETASDRKQSSGQEDKSASGALSAVKKMVSYSAVRAVADDLISFEIGQVSLKTGATEYEQRLSTSYNIGKQVLDTGVSLGVGIATGTLPLVLVGIAKNVIQKSIEIYQKLQELARKETLENVSIQMANIRAGNSGRRGT